LARVYDEKDDTTQAIESLTRAIEVYDSLLRDDPENFSVLRDAIIALDQRGKSFLGVAEKEELSQDRRLEAVTNARHDFQKYRDGILRLRDRGRLDESELRFIDNANEKIESCSRLEAAIRDKDGTP
jgi:hypothetical protein